MPRPRRSQERRTQVLDAFEECLVARGLAGSSLDATARAAGLSRQLLLHYFGDREALVRAAVERIAARYRERIAARAGAAGDAERLDDLLAWIFLGDFCDPRTDAILDELRLHARRHAAVREALGAAYAELAAVLRDELAKALPRAAARDVARTAHALLALCFGSGELQAVGLPPAHPEDLHRTATQLVDALRRTS